MTNPTNPEVSEEMVNAAFKALPDEAHGILGAGEMERVLIAALARRFPPADNAVAVKALEWAKVGVRLVADKYEILRVLSGGGAHPVRLGGTLALEYLWFAGEDEAKAAAQTDYETRIRSALEPTPSYAEGRAAGLPVDELIELNVIGGTDDFPVVNRAGLIGSIRDAIAGLVGAAL